VSALSPQSFRYEVAGAVATITLDRPDRLNALTFQVYEELRDLFAALAREDGVRAVVITGKGRAFCSGGDVKEIIGPLFDRDPAGRLDFTRLTCDLVRQMRRLPKPIVAALNGTVAGAGAAIALASDFRVASEEAKIAFLFVKVGLSGADMGAAFYLPRVVGAGRAMEILALGEFVEAREAERIGLYNRVVPGAGLRDPDDEIADRPGDGARPRERPAARSGSPGDLHGAPRLQGGLRGLPCAARSEVPLTDEGRAGRTTRTTTRTTTRRRQHRESRQKARGPQGSAAHGR
jgi:enoyl-CoA hydratase/carnithine racemase